MIEALLLLVFGILLAGWLIERHWRRPIRWQEITPGDIMGAEFLRRRLNRSKQKEK